MKKLFGIISPMLTVISFLVFYIFATASCGQKFTCPTYTGCQSKRQFQPFDDSISKMASAQKRIIKKAQKENRSSLSFKGHKRRVTLSEWIENLFAQGHQ